MPKKEKVEEKNDERPREQISRMKLCDEIYEAIYLGSTPVFLVFNNKKKTWSIRENIQDVDKVYVPIQKEGAPYRPYTFSKERMQELLNGEYKPSIQEIFNDILNQIELFIDVREEDQILIAAEIIESYIQFKLPAIGYLFLEGPPGTGKTNACKLILDMAYRVMYSADNNAADIYNYVGYKEEDEAQMMIVEDEVDWTNLTPNLSKKMKIYRIGYKSGTTVPRILDGSKSSRRMVFYRAYCSKVFAGYGLPNDNAFRQRCISIVFMDGEPIKDEILEEDRMKFGEIKSELLLWKMYHYFDKLPDFEYPRIKKRNKEIWKCKILALDGIEQQKTLVKMAHKNIEEEMEIRSNSLEAYVVRAVETVANETWGWEGIPFIHIWKQLCKDLDVTTVDAYIDPKYKFSSELVQTEVNRKKVGRILNVLLRGRPGLKRMELTDVNEEIKPYRVWTFDKEKARMLLRSYKQLEEGDIGNEDVSNVDEIKKEERDSVYDTGEDDDNVFSTE